MITPGKLAYVELCFSPSVDFVSVVRRFVADFCDKFCDADGTARVALATHEMLENAARYSTDGESRIRAEAARVEGGDKHQVSIRTWNRATPENIAVLEGNFREMNEAPDAFAYYNSLLKRNVKRAGSGLGLARIRAEGELELAFESNDGVVMITAQAVLG